MPPPKKQYLKSFSTEDEKPLLELKCSPYKILWKLFFWFIFISICLLAVVVISEVNRKIHGGSWGESYLFSCQGELCVFATRSYVGVVISFFAFIFGIIKIIKILSTGNLKLYHDRVEKHYVFGKRTVNLEGAHIFIIGDEFRGVPLWRSYHKNTATCTESNSNIAPEDDYIRVEVVGKDNDISCDISFWRNRVENLNSFINYCKSLGIEFMRCSRIIYKNIKK